MQRVLAELYAVNQDDKPGSCYFRRCCCDIEAIGVGLYVSDGSRRSRIWGSVNVVVLVKTCARASRSCSDSVVSLASVAFRATASSVVHHKIRVCIFGFKFIGMSIMMK